IVINSPAHLIAIAPRLQSRAGKRAFSILGRGHELRIMELISFSDLARELLHMSSHLVAQCDLFSCQRWQRSMETFPGHSDHDPPCCTTNHCDRNDKPRHTTPGTDNVHLTSALSYPIFFLNRSAQIKKSMIDMIIRITRCRQYSKKCAPRRMVERALVR